MALNLVGIRESDVLRKPFWETPWCKHSEKMQNKLKEAVREATRGKTVRFEATHQTADGSLHYVDFSIKPLMNANEQVVLLIPESRDITNLKQATEMLQKSEEKYRFLADNTSDILWVASLNLEMTYVSPSILRLS
ncbi:MAG: PAS domain-containing protein [Candidatus Omnitrophica bacterium]|nr:PAS domain-containing protein [Candidatus Omnitrophota bacterium]